MEIGPIRNQNLILCPLASEWCQQREKSDWQEGSIAPKKRTMPLAEKMKFPVGIGSGHFSFSFFRSKMVTIEKTFTSPQHHTWLAERN